MKKRTLRLRLVGGEEIIFLSESFNFATKEGGETVVSIYGHDELLCVQETTQEIAEMLDNLED